jgi:hypothetical protein
MTIIDAKADTGELQAAVTNFGSDHMQRLLELKGEVTSKISEIISML